MRVALFFGGSHALGGIEDFKGWFDTPEDAQRYLDTLRPAQKEWAQITDVNLKLLKYWKPDESLFNGGCWVDGGSA